MKTIACLSMLVGAVSLLSLAKPVIAQAAKPVQCGKASWYAMTSRTASGERANPNSITAAHRTLKFGTKVRVTNLRNGKSMIVRINDRGPFIKGRVIDVTRKVAAQLGFKNAGWTRVAVSRPDAKVSKKSCS